MYEPTPESDKSIRVNYWLSYFSTLMTVDLGDITF